MRFLRYLCVCLCLSVVIVVSRKECNPNPLIVETHPPEMMLMSSTPHQPSQNTNTKGNGMTGNVSSHLPPRNRRRITRFVANVARNLAATAIESAHRLAEGQANQASETGARPLNHDASLFHTTPLDAKQTMR